MNRLKETLSETFESYIIGVAGGMSVVAVTQTSDFLTLFLYLLVTFILLVVANYGSRRLNDV